MPFAGFVILALVFIKTCQSLDASECGSYFRRPEYTDIFVQCGTTSVELAIIACPVIYMGYNESLLVLNSILNNPVCQGRLDTSVVPQVVRFSFPLNQSQACDSVFKTTNTAGSGVFADFSQIETVNVSGVVRSNDLTLGTVTYNTELKYFYSCSYPLEYLINNTKVDVSSSSIAVKDNNGSFISTLSLHLYKDENYTSPLVISPLGIELRTEIFVQVKATNLTSQYFVLLDRCYASVSPQPTNTTFFNLFITCSNDPQTKMLENGKSQQARFSFPAFRFTEQQNETVSTYFLHCITRLCEKTTCSQFMCPARRKRSAVTTTLAPAGISYPTTITSQPIITRAESVLSSKEEGLTGYGSNSNGSLGLGLAVGILALISVASIVMALVVYKKLIPFPGKWMVHK